MQHQHIEERHDNTLASIQFDSNADITPFPWTVALHPDTEGGYIIQEARHEQQVWCDQGYDISDEEGERRCVIGAWHNVGNVLLLQAAPELFAALRNMMASPEEGKKAAIRALERVSPAWWDLKITGHQGQRA